MIRWTIFSMCTVLLMSAVAGLSLHTAELLKVLICTCWVSCCPACRIKGAFRVFSSLYSDRSTKRAFWLHTSVCWWSVCAATAVCVFHESTCMTVLLFCLRVFPPGLAVGLGIGALAEVAKKSIRHNGAGKSPTLLNVQGCSRRSVGLLVYVMLVCARSSLCFHHIIQRIHIQLFVLTVC